MPSERADLGVRRARYVLVGLAGGIAVVSIVGWLLGLLVLASVSASYVPMAPVTAAVLLAVCVAIVLRSGRTSPRTRAVLLGLAAIVVVAILALVDFGLGVPVSLDRLVVPHPQVVSGVQTGRMSPVTAMAFALLGVALMLLETDGRARARAAVVLSLLVTGGASVLLVGYVYDAPLLYSAGLIPVALPTAACLALVGVATSTLAGSEHWPLSLFVGDSVRAQLMRGVLPVVVIAALAMAGLDAASRRLGIGQDPVIVSVILIGALAIISTTVLRVAATIGGRLDVAISRRKVAEAERDAYQQHLEALVVSRTEELETANEQLAATNEQLAAANEELEATNQQLTSTNDELALATRAKSEFLANMSHELRTPLNSIIGFTGVLTQGLAGEINEEQRAQLNMVRHSGERLLALINDVLDLSRVEAGGVIVRPADVHVSELVQTASDTVRPLAEAAGLEFDVGAVPDVTMHTDPQKLDQILVNLLANAVKFTDEGRVSLEVGAQDGDTVVFRVSDTGVGIAKEDIDAIFGEFVQVAPGEGKPEGTGLGLAISRRLADLLGGKLTAASVIGKGSTFTLTLPRVHPAPRDLGT